MLSAEAQWILEEQKAFLAKQGIVSNIIFPDKNGEAVTQKEYRNRWKRYCKYHGFTKGTQPYELRHTFASVTGEMPLHFKKLLIRHSGNMDTEGVYGHEVDGDLERAAQYVDDAFQRLIERDRTKTALPEHGEEKGS